MAVGLATLLVLAGCGAPADRPELRDGWQFPEDPRADQLGWENGVWYNESLAINASDGLNASEQEAFVARTMARVERLRGLEFRATVPVEVITREEYRERISPDTGPQATHDSRNLMWEALLVIGEGTNATREFQTLYGRAVVGYYSPSRDRIVIVSDAPQPSIRRSTLAHELVHALQDQHFGRTTRHTLDGRLAAQGLTEGDPQYVEKLYERKCEADWDCVANPPARSPPGEPINRGLFAVLFQPYANGPAFIEHLRATGGWAAVNAAYQQPPTSTEQVIHPSLYPTEPVVDVTVPDRSSGAWSRVPGGSDRLGEVGLFTLLWYQGYVDRGSRTMTAANYSSQPTAGWAGDEFVPYRNGSALGYVWEIRFDSAADARDFVSAYTTTLKLSLGARRLSDSVFRVSTGPFADAFRVSQTGRTVRIVNAPTVEALEAVHSRERNSGVVARSARTEGMPRTGGRAGRIVPPRPDQTPTA